MSPEEFDNLIKNLDLTNQASIDEFKNIADELGVDADGLLKKIDDSIIIKVDYGDQYTKVGNKKALKPNVEYIDNNGYKYTTDGKGRISNVQGDLKLGEGKRNPYAQRTVGGTDRLPTDDGGHLIGTQFNGSGEIDNLILQNSGINRAGGEWYKMEQEWAEAIRNGSSVRVDIKPQYVGDSVRPTSIRVDYWIDGKKFSEIIPN